MALLLDTILDTLNTAIEAKIPRTLPAIRFTRHRNAALLANASSNPRAFQIVIPNLLGNDTIPARSDGESCWYATENFLVKIWYPETWQIDGDSTARGLSGLQVQDTIDLNKLLCYDDPLVALGGSYDSLQFKGTYQEGRLWVLRYLFAWQELFNA